MPEVYKTLGITEPTYYRWRQKHGGIAPDLAKHESRRWALDAELLAEVRSISQGRPCLGSPRVCEARRRRGHEVNHKRVERQWRKHGMSVAVSRGCCA